MTTTTREHVHAQPVERAAELREALRRAAVHNSNLAADPGVTEGFDSQARKNHAQAALALTQAYATLYRSAGERAGGR